MSVSMIRPRCLSCNRVLPGKMRNPDRNNPGKVSEDCVRCLNAKVIYDLPPIQAMKYLDKEHFMMLVLNTQYQATDLYNVSIGTLNASLVHPREAFKHAIRHAILNNACAIAFVHNHPSGMLDPSSDDINITERLIKTGRVVGIEVLDHIIVSSQGYRSMRDENDSLLDW